MRRSEQVMATFHMSSRVSESQCEFLISCSARMLKVGSKRIRFTFSRRSAWFSGRCKESFASISAKSEWYTRTKFVVYCLMRSLDCAHGKLVSQLFSSPRLEPLEIPPACIGNNTAVVPVLEVSITAGVKWACDCLRENTWSCSIPAPEALWRACTSACISSKRGVKYSFSQRRFAKVRNKLHSFSACVNRSFRKMYSSRSPRKSARSWRSISSNFDHESWHQRTLFTPPWPVSIYRCLNEKTVPCPHNLDPVKRARWIFLLRNRRACTVPEALQCPENFPESVKSFPRP